MFTTAIAFALVSSASASCTPPKLSLTEFISTDRNNPDSLINQCAGTSSGYPQITDAEFAEKFGPGTVACAGDEAYTSAIHAAIANGLFGLKDDLIGNDERDCSAYCLYDYKWKGPNKRSFRWKNDKKCWKKLNNAYCSGANGGEKANAKALYNNVLCKPCEKNAWLSSVGNFATKGTKSGSCELQTQQQCGFVGEFDSNNWVVTTNGGSGSASVTVSELRVQGSNRGSGGYTATTAVIPAVSATTTISFDWSYTTDDASAIWDPAFYINGVKTKLTNDNLYSQSGSRTITVQAGATLGFSVDTVDNIAGAATLRITSFCATTRTEPAYLEQSAGSNCEWLSDKVEIPTTYGSANAYKQLFLGATIDERDVETTEKFLFQLRTCTGTDDSTCGTWVDNMHIKGPFSQPEDGSEYIYSAFGISQDASNTANIPIVIKKDGSFFTNLNGDFTQTDMSTSPGDKYVQARVVIENNGESDEYQRVLSVDFGASCNDPTSV